MDEIHVAGKCSLKGEVTIQGSKNAALPMIAASLMHRGISVLRGCPKITDVFCMEKILESLGAVTWWEDHDLYLDCTMADGTRITPVWTGRMRSSVILLGAVLARNKKCRIGYPGGCIIGKRPIDLHLMALRGLGAEIRETASELDAECSGFHGGEISFAKSSVGATQQAMLAAVLAEGETILHNCAKEPEVFWLGRYLKSMGARIEGEETGEILIRGVRELGPGNYRIPPDRIVAGTYLCAAAASGSEILLRNVPVEELKAFLKVYEKIGGQYEVNSGTLRVNGKKALRSAGLIETYEYPGFPTDLQAPIMAVLTGIPGQSMIRERIFDRRFASAFQMNKMGADIEIRGSQAVIRGGKPLTGTTVEAGDLRGGAALIIAALMADGETCITQAELIGRGYEHICKDLQILGCKIWQSASEDLKIYEKK